MIHANELHQISRENSGLIIPDSVWIKLKDYAEMGFFYGLLQFELDLAIPANWTSERYARKKLVEAFKREMELLGYQVECIYHYSEPQNEISYLKVSW